MLLPVCVCAVNRIAAEHTLDIHDERTGACRWTDGHGSSCGCQYFRDSGRRVEVPGGG